MKPRVIASYKILAVALATASCGKATTSEHEQTSASPPVPAPSASGSQATPAVGPAVVSDDKADTNLLLLRAELVGETRESAFAKQAHYRPLCDKEGYPLVGNMNRKGGGPQPSELCADVRVKKAKST